MDAPSREVALEKLRSMIFLIGGPDSPTQYGFEMAENDFFGNAMAAQTWSVRDALARLVEPVDRRRCALHTRTHAHARARTRTRTHAHARTRTRARTDGAHAHTRARTRTDGAHALGSGGALQMGLDVACVGQRVLCAARQRAVRSGGDHAAAVPARRDPG